MHTVETDGRNTIEEMAEAARERGYQYMAITDHSKNLAFANGLDDARAVEHVKKIRVANDANHGIRIFETDASHAARRTAHWAHIFLVEANALPIFGDQNYLILPAGQLHIDQRIARFNEDCDNPALADVAELRKRGFLDGPLLRRKEEKICLLPR